MPVIGEIQRGATIGYKSSGKFIWSTCVCGKKTRWVALVDNKPRDIYCRSCSGLRERAYSWKGGRRIKNGYIRIMLNPNDFFYPMTDKQGTVLEHRLIVAKSLRRNLHLWETIHHKNGIRDDNRKENLQLTSTDVHNSLTRMQHKIDYLQGILDKHGIKYQ